MGQGDSIPMESQFMKYAGLLQNGDGDSMTLHPPENQRFGKDFLLEEPAGLLETETSLTLALGGNLLLYYGFRRPVRGYGVRMTMHNLPGAVFGPEDHSNSQRRR